jgi:sorting nexin-25
MGMGMGIGVDDGASVAGSAMTFMDGAMGGRTSQYGLPKYPHQAKPDPRR